MSVERQIWTDWSNDGSKQQDRLAAPVLSGHALTGVSVDLPSSLFRSALEISDEALAICACAAESPVIIYANAAFCALTGYEMMDLYGQPYDFMVVARRSREEAMAAPHSTAAKVRCLRRDGTKRVVTLRMTPLLSGNRGITHYLVGVREMNEAQHRMEQFRFLAHHDALTGLPNRLLLLDRLERALERYGRYAEGFTVAFVDLDGFKQINDELGHCAGDAVLKHVAFCLSRSVRASDTVGRLGGDEFLVLISGASTPTDVEESLARVETFLGEPFDVAGKRINVGFSIGVATCPHDGVTVPELLRHADSSMYREKRHLRVARPSDDH